MSFSYQEEVSNGVQTVYAVDFDFRNTNTIYVYAGEHNTYATQLSWQWVTGNTQIELTNLSEVPAGTKFYIRRIIDREQLTHTFENKSMRGKLIDEQNYAALYLMQEIMDGFIDRDNASPIPLGLDMLGQAITNLKDGINDTDAVTLGQAKNLVGNLYGRALVQLSTDPVPQPSTVNEGQRMIFIDTLDEFTLVGGMWVEDGNVGDEVDVTAASHLTLAQAQASDLKVGQYVRLTDYGNALYKVVSVGDTGALYVTLTGSLKLEYIPITASRGLEVNLTSLGLVSGGDIYPLAQTVADWLFTKGGGKIVLDFDDYIASGQTNLKQGVSVLGQGIGRTKVAATSAMNASQSIIYAPEPFSDINDISFLCNSDGINGAGSGFHTVGSDHDVSRTYVSNSTQAGIRLEDPVRVKLEWYRLESCGRAGYTDNHGVMIYTTKAMTITDVSVNHGNVANSFRKGITTAVTGGGVVDGLRVNFNTVFGSGLGNYYIGGPTHYNVEVLHNIGYGSPVGMQLQLKQSKANFNTIKDTSDDFGIGGYDLDDVELIGNTTNNTALAGIKLFSPAGEVNKNVRMFLNTCKLANRRNLGAPSIELVKTTGSMFGMNTMDETEDPKATYGIYEHDDCNDNKFLFNDIKGATVDKYRIAGADSTVEYADSSDKHKQITLADGANNDVNVTLGAGSATITGPTAPYSITGITGGRLGRTLKLVNSTAFELTLVINSGSSAVGNRLYLTGSVNKVIPAWGAVELTYLEVQGGQFWMDV